MKARRFFVSTAIIATMFLGLTGCNKEDTIIIDETVEANDLIEEFEISGLVDFTNVENVTDQEIKEKIESYLQNNVVYEHINEGVVLQDSIININYTGTINNLTFNGSNIENYFLNISNNDFINGFAEQCIGHSVGEKFDIQITFPENHNGTYIDSEGKEMPLAGVTAIYSVKINYIAGNRYLSYDELNDSIVFDLTGGYYDTLEKFYNATKQELIVKKGNDLEYQMWEQLVSNVKYKEGKESTIEKMVNEEYNNQLNYYSEMADYYEIELKTFITQNLGYKNKETYEKAIKEKAEYKVKQNIIVDYLANENNLVIDDSNYSELATILANEYGYNLLSDFEEQYTKEEICEFLQYNIVTEFLKENNGYIK